MSKRRTVEDCSLEGSNILSKEPVVDPDGGAIPHPLFGRGTWKFQERSKLTGDIITTEFDGERIGQRTLYERDTYRKHLRDVRGNYVDSNGFTKKRDGRHIAEVPMHLWLQWEREYGFMTIRKDKKLLKRLIREHGLAVVSGKF